ncbi:hypothetical protein ACHQM5_003472 [Ranunculus cassubicifolius]
MDIKAPDPQIWRNNDVFDNGDSIEFIPSKDSIFLANPIFLNPSDLGSSKEMGTPIVGKSLVSMKSSTPMKPIYPNCSTVNSVGKPLKILFKQGIIRCPPETELNDESEVEFDDGEIDVEIEEIEMEISRLSSKLEALRVRKVENGLKSRKKIENLASKKSIVTEEGAGNVMENRKRKFLGRDLNLGASEIKADNRSQITYKLQKNLSIQSRQIRRKSCFPKLQNVDKEKVAGNRDSLGLSKSVRSKAMVEPQVSSVQVMQSRKKPALLNIQELNEDKVTKQRGGRSLSLSPESRLTVATIQESRRRLTTVGGKKPGKDIAILSSIQPKTLFKGGISVGSKKPVKNARVIASRYNQVSSQKSERRKWSLPGDNKENVEQSRDFAEDLDLNQMSASRRVKKQWEIPSEVIMHHSFGESPPPPPSSFSKMADIIPKIRINKCAKGSPRDSGPAKRVVELVGRKSYFGTEAGLKNASVCQALRFGGEDDHWNM